MSLNKSNGQMYPWIDATWNPIKGCLHDCTYCYVKALEKQYGYDFHTPRLAEKALKVDLYSQKRGITIFVGSTADMWGEWVPDEWIEAVIVHCRDYPENTYLFQSKNPGRFSSFWNSFPIHTVLGTTIETNRFIPSVSKAPSPFRRAMEMMGSRRYNRMVSIEPIMDFDVGELTEWMEAIMPDFVSIGADSKGHHLSEPSGEKTLALIAELETFTEVRIKPNLKRITG